MTRNNKACNYWTDGNYCGDANTRRYMNGWRCIKHIPAAIRKGARPRQRKNNNMTTKYCSDEQLEPVINTPSTPWTASCGVPLGTLNLINGDTWRPAQFASSLSRFLCDQAACWPRGRRV